VFQILDINYISFKKSNMSLRIAENTGEDLGLTVTLCSVLRDIFNSGNYYFIKISF